jgi:hypothetical protein
VARGQLRTPPWEVREAAFLDEGFFDLVGPRAGLRFDRVAGRSPQRFPGCFRPFLGPGEQVPSLSMMAWAKHVSGCSAPASRRVSSITSSRGTLLAWSKRRPKSPAVVGAGKRRAPKESRKLSSVRRSSRSCRHVPSHRALSAKARTCSDA